MQDERVIHYMRKTSYGDAHVAILQQSRRREVPRFSYWQRTRRCERPECLARRGVDKRTHTSGATCRKHVTGAEYIGIQRFAYRSFSKAWVTLRSKVKHNVRCQLLEHATKRDFISDIAVEVIDRLDALCAGRGSSPAEADEPLGS